MSRVLIVEDHRNLLRSLRRGLELLGHEVLTSETGEEGFLIATTQGVEIIVLDLMLPDRNGFEILRDLRTAGIPQPVLILTAKDSPEDRERARECGADGFLIKPFAFSDLVARVTELLEKAATRTSATGEPRCED